MPDFWARRTRPAAAVLAASVLIAPMFASRAGASTPRGVEPAAATPSAVPIPDRYIVTFHASSSAADVASARDGVGERGGVLHFEYTHAVKGFAATLSEEALEPLGNNPSVRAIETDQMVQVTGIQVPAPWGLDRADQRVLPLTGSYTYAATGSGVTAYVIDTGIRSTHTEFGGRVEEGFTAISDGYGTSDCNGHGTHVAGTIGGSTYGVAKAVTLVPVRVLDCNGSGTYSGVIAGIDWVTAQHTTGPAVANMSLGGGASSALDTAVANSITDGVSYAVAAGNSNVDACTSSPARVPAAITVGASTSSDSRASYSNFGTCLDLFGPGSGITSATDADDSAITTLSGTSMAAPHVAGVIATYLQAVPAALPAEVRNVLISSATTNALTDIGTGSPNALLHSVLSTPTVPELINVAPVAVAPMSAIAPANRIGSSTVPVRVSWSASDLDGIASYHLQRSVDGGHSWSTVALPAATATSVTLNLAPSAGLRFRVRATDTLGAVGAYATAPTFALSLHQQKSAASVYPTGTWKTKKHSSASGGSYRTSRTKGAKVRVTFTGTQVNWIGITASSRGKAKVYLDGVFQKTVDTYSSTRQFRRILFSKTTAPGKHTLVIRVLGKRNVKSSGNYIDVDAFVVKS